MEKSYGKFLDKVPVITKTGNSLSGSLPSFLFERALWALGVSAKIQILEFFSGLLPINPVFQLHECSFDQPTAL